MATFYGTIQGHRTQATRTGTKNSGIRASVQSWRGSIITELFENDGQLFIRVELAKGASMCSGSTIFSGTLEEFEKKLNN